MPQNKPIFRCPFYNTQIHRFHNLNFQYNHAENPLNYLNQKLKHNFEIPRPFYWRLQCLLMLPCKVEYYWSTVNIIRPLSIGRFNVTVMFYIGQLHQRIVAERIYAGCVSAWECYGITL